MGCDTGRIGFLPSIKKNKYFRKRIAGMPITLTVIPGWSPDEGPLPQKTVYS